jgi:hypothetical protein
MTGLAGGALALHGAATPDEPVHLTGKLSAPNEVALEWKDSTPNVAGHTVEFTTEASPEFIILGFLPPNENKFTHSRLAPTTTYSYRVRAFYGPVSNAVTVTLPKELTDAEYAAKFAVPEDYSWAGPQTIEPKSEVKMHSIREVKTADQGAPTDLKADLVKTTVSAFKLTWTDHASDADGYVLETAAEGSSDFKVCAVMDPHINSFGFAFSPPVRSGQFRVRAFYYSKPSNVVEQRTGSSPDLDDLGTTNPSSAKPTDH